MRVVHAGDGYTYLLNSVASYDDSTKPETHLHDYYNATGTPPGRWFGRGLAGLGETTATEQTVVEEEQMAALYGAGLHPDAELKIRDGANYSDTQLGREYPSYSKGVPVLEAVSAAEKNFRATHGRKPNEDERNSLALEIARPFYEADAGVEASDSREVLAWLTEKKNSVRQPVAGMDLTFSPTKSVSILWALADDSTRQAIQNIHEQAVKDSLSWIENELLFTRTGARSERQIKAAGMMAATFLHYDTREGDPDLHTHCLISNKVQAHEDAGLDPASAQKWRALDTRFLFKNSAKIGQRYQRMMVHRLTEELGLSFHARASDDAKEPVWEVDGISDDLIESFSGRRSNARPTYEKYASDYAVKHGHAPSSRARYRLWQQAILDTRDAKKPAQSLADHRAHWRTMTDPSVLGSVLSQTPDDRPQFPVANTEERADAVVMLAVLAVEHSRSLRAQFAPRHLDTSISMHLNHWRYNSEDEENEVREAAIKHAMTHLVEAYDDTPQATLPSALIRADGLVVDRDSEAVRLVARATLAEEETVLDSLGEITANVATAQAVDEALATRERNTGFSLNTGQVALVRHFVETGAQITAGVGPAGTGKTASMAVVADVVKNLGHNVIALAPSAQAAQNLAVDLNTEGHTLASLTYPWRGVIGDSPRDPAALGVDIKPGDMLLVDEAGMATTADLAAIVEIAGATGAVVRLVGDPHQLDAVETGGLFRTIVKRDDSVELDQVMRMGADTAQAEAGLAIRHGDATGLDLYDDRGWLHYGARADMVTQAASDHLADEARGRTSILIAATRQDVNTANQIIQDARRDAGLLATGRPSADLGTGHTVYVGDTIITRRNQAIDTTRVRNGQRFIVEAVTKDGAIRARSAENGRIVTLPTDYVANHVQLGYAATIHRAQGVTVDAARAVVGPETDRRGLYVAMTRGKKQNHVYVATDAALDFDAEDAHWHMAGDNAAADYRDILRTIVTRDRGQISATDIRDELHREANSPDRLRELYASAADMLTHDWRTNAVEPHIRRVLDTLPARDVEALDENKAVERISTAAVALAFHGIDYRDLIGAATEGLEGSHDIAAVIAHRLREQLPHERPELAALPPRYAGVDAELYEWAVATNDELRPRGRELRPLEIPLPDKGTIEGQDFSQVDLRGMNLSNLRFVDCDFTGAALDDAELHRVTFKNTDLTGATLTGLRVGEGDRALHFTRFSSCDMTAVDLTGASLRNTHVIGTTMRSAVLRDVHLISTNVNTADFTDADFTNLAVGDFVTVENSVLPEHAPAALLDKVDDDLTSAVTSQADVAGNDPALLNHQRQDDHTL